MRLPRHFSIGMANKILAILDVASTPSQDEISHFAIMKSLLTFLILPAFIGCMTNVVTPTAVAAESETWQPPFDGAEPGVLYLPDAHCVYWRYGWKRKPGDTAGIQIKGEFPDARYFSFNVYNDDTKMTLGSFSDYDLKADHGAPNPFLGQTVNGSASTYTISILPDGATCDDPNVLRFPDATENVSVLLRFYLAEKDLKGGKPMPVISLYDSKTKTTKPAPESSKVPKLSKQEVKKYLLPLAKKMATQFEEDPASLLQTLEHRKSGESLKISELICKQVVAPAFLFSAPGEPVHAYNFQTEGTYPNKDNHYLTMPIIRKGDDVLLVKFKAPKFPASAKDSPSAEVRYFSISQGDDLTYNFATLYDKEFTIQADGFIRLLIGNDTPELRRKAAELHVDFMPWKVHDKMLLVYRHMIPRKDFSGATDKVPLAKHDKPKAGQEGNAFIGDYSPTGKFFPLKEVLSVATLDF